MAVSAMLRTTEVTVAPGGSGRCHVLVRNNSAVVDQFAFTVRGDVADWTEVKPARVNLMPNQEVGVELTFSPPRSPDVLAGPHPFALQVSSREDPVGSVVQEGTVVVEEFTEVAAEVVPVTSSGRRKGRHTLAVDNLGNHTHAVEVTAADPDAKLTFRIRPHAPRVEPGTATFVTVKARPRRYFWKGPDRLLPFAVKILVPDGEPVVVDAKVQQLPLVPRRLFWLFSILLGLLIILAILILALLRQRPVSIAGPSPSKGQSAVSTPLSTAPPTSTSSPPATPTGTPSAAGARQVVGGGGDSTRIPSAARPVTDTFTIRAAAAPEVAGPQLFSYVVPAGPRQRVISVRLTGPGTDSGRVEVRHGDTPLGSYPLSALTGTGVLMEPKPAPLLAPGDLFTLAVECANRENRCVPEAVVTTALVR